MSQNRALAQEIGLGSPDHFPHERVGSGDETTGDGGNVHYIYHVLWLVKWPLRTSEQHTRFMFGPHTQYMYGRHTQYMYVSYNYGTCMKCENFRRFSGHVSMNTVDSGY